MPQNVYIHIPFCKSKCKYCSFVSFSELEKKTLYLNTLKEEINHYYKNELLKTLYFGGGTPSLLSIDEFKELINLFKTDKNTEITAELNPETLTLEYLKGLHGIGINRISIGCQTFDDNILKLIGRRHNSKQVLQAVEMAKQSGFDNINLDFIYGLPNQNLKGFTNDLKKAVSLKIQHISLYGLKIEENCYFYKNMPENIADDDMQAQMYIEAIETLKDFEHYEISNFGKPSKHNLNYWNNNTYYGFGVSAHGYCDNIRYSNALTLDEYIKNPTKHKEEIILTPQQQLEEEIFLGFRKTEGININEINKKFSIDFERKYADILDKYKQYFIKTDTNYALNTNGILISNCILSEFLE